MTPSPSDDPRAELLQILGETRRHLDWLEDAGVRVLRRDSSGAARAAPAPSSSRGAPAPQRPAAAPLADRPAAAPSPAAPPTAAPRAAPSPAAPAVRPVPQAPSSPAPAAPAARAPAAPSSRAEALRLIREDLGECRRCGLCSGRSNIVFGQGHPEAEVVFLGEGPGQDEDLSGLAFVGRAGELLTRMIEAMGFSREQVYICNIVKCRPPGNRKPEPPEVEACRPFVERQILAIRPQVVVALGATAAQSLLRVDTPISRLRNNWNDWNGIPVMPTFHPSYLLRAPQEKAKAWEDLKLVLARLGREPVRR